MSEDMADMSEDCKEYHEIVIKTFVREEDGFNFYNSYALEKGFSMRRSYVEWNEANKEIILRKFVCSREGCREEKHMKRKRADMKSPPGSKSTDRYNACSSRSRSSEEDVS
ncbi:protein FAR1-RELATED SEQUENCE 5-like [Lolium rigidum]|uniref:protein FAR1-RELATED SEQUENCE 5-like n=1 Tax=Lolium rigidum TaxID=89674 RepID=UPI001F5C9E99|nr:protein FAR1-RELATED SEQUENCE 5-like [Lolium rigidum]